jgi:HEAT repeat protein
MATDDADPLARIWAQLRQGRQQGPMSPGSEAHQFRPDPPLDEAQAAAFDATAMATADADPIVRIRAKLEQVRQRGLMCFGSEAHGFRLDPPLAEAEVAEFEAEHGVAVPPACRRFLTELGGGGAGPYCGVFPLAGGWLGGGAGPRADAPAPDTDTDADADADDPGDLLLIADRGCTYAVAMAVSGPHYGRIAHVEIDELSHEFLRDADFLAWYERWLDEMLWGFNTDDFGYGLPGTAADMLRVLADRAAPPDVVADALTTLVRVPTPGPSILAAVRAAVGHPAAQVRARALRVIRQGRDAAGYAAAVDALRDGSPLVRDAALATVASLAGDGWLAAARSMMNDPDSDVAERAVVILRTARQLTWAEVRPLLSRESQPRVAWAAAGAVCHVPEAADPLALFARILDDGGHAGATMTAISMALGRGGGTRLVELLIRASTHPDVAVRCDVARALGKIGDPAAIPTLRRMATEPFLRSCPPIGDGTEPTTGRGVGSWAQWALNQVAGPQPDRADPTSAP